MEGAFKDRNKDFYLLKNPLFALWLLSYLKKKATKIYIKYNFKSQINLSMLIKKKKKK